ncbi:hypothetical protein [Streptomyces sp. NPDC048489]|uniref:hypothetical protein n=1 Tax=Streptomyces sp. NPDC048489 TaxID=3154504 RepID=UPI00342D5865
MPYTLPEIAYEVHRKPGTGLFPDEPAATIHQTHRTHAPFVRTRIKRFLAAGYAVTGGLRGTEKVAAARHLAHNLPDGPEPWVFTDTELSMLGSVLAWGDYDPARHLPENLLVRDAILAAYKARFSRKA